MHIFLAKARQKGYMYFILHFNAIWLFDVIPFNLWEQVINIPFQLRCESLVPVLNGPCSIKDESFLFCFGAMAHTHIFSSIKGILHCTIIKTFLYTFYNMTKHIGMPTRKIVQIYFYVLVCRAKKCHWNLPKSSKSIHQAQSPPTIFII